MAGGRGWADRAHELGSTAHLEGTGRGSCDCALPAQSGTAASALLVVPRGKLQHCIHEALRWQTLQSAASCRGQSGEGKPSDHAPVALVGHHLAEARQGGDDGQLQSAV